MTLGGGEMTGYHQVTCNWNIATSPVHEKNVQSFLALVK